MSEKAVAFQQYVENVRHESVALEDIQSFFIIREKTKRSEGLSDEEANLEAQFYMDYDDFKASLAVTKRKKNIVPSSRKRRRYVVQDEVEVDDDVDDGEDEDEIEDELDREEDELVDDDEEEEDDELIDDDEEQEEDNELFHGENEKENELFDELNEMAVNDQEDSEEEEDDISLPISSSVAPLSLACFSSFVAPSLSSSVTHNSVASSSVTHNSVASSSVIHNSVVRSSSSVTHNSVARSKEEKNHWNSDAYRIVRSTSLYRFLNARRVGNSMKSMTHYGMPGPLMGKYHIPLEEEEKLLTLYSEAVFDRRGLALNLGERHRELGPVVIDLDFKYNTPMDDPSTRIYTMVFVKHLIAAYYVQFEYLLKLEDVRNKELCIVLGKNEASTSSKNPNQFKDGLHIQFPNIITTPLLQKIIRKNVVSNPTIRQMFADLNVSNSLEDVIDEAVIQKNGWMLYRSRKFNGAEASRHWYRQDVNDGCCGVYTAGTDVMNVTKIDNFEEHQLVRLLSIRQAQWSDLIELTLEGLTITNIETSQQRQQDIAIAKRTFTFDAIEPSICKGDLDYVIGLVRLLHPLRVESHNSWMQIGWCLFNIDVRLLSSWIDMTRLDPDRALTCVERCTAEWEIMCRTSSRGVKSGLGTLSMMAKEDSPMDFKVYMRKSIWYKIQTCCSKHISIHTEEDKKGVKSLKLKMGTFEDICYYLVDIVHHYYSNVMVCTSFQKKSWMYFHNHRWFASDRCIDLCFLVDEDMYSVFAYWEIVFQNEAKLIDPAVDEKGHFRKNGYAAACREFSRALRNPNKKRVLIEMCAEKMFWTRNNKFKVNVDQFEEQLDDDIMLIGLNNGVYDLNACQFRYGRPEDLVSMTTRNNYYEFSMSHPLILQIEDFMSKVFPVEIIRTYACKLLASFLDGHLLEKFYIWTGVGSNGKSKLMELFTLAMGNYCGTLPVTLVTGKRQVSSGATPELCRMKGKRLGTMHESNHNDSMDMGLVKSTTGGDMLYTRGLFKDPIEFRPTFQMVLLCNKKPKRIDSTDIGAWRRISILRFSSRFVENPVNEDEFQKDDYLDEKLILWKEAFFWYMTMWYQRLKREGNQEPDQVRNDTEEYKYSNNIIAQFLDATVVRTDHIGDAIVVGQLFNEFLEYEKNNNHEKSSINRTLFEEQAVQELGPFNHPNGQAKGWYNIFQKKSFLENVPMGSTKASKTPARKAPANTSKSAKILRNVMTTKAATSAKASRSLTSSSSRSTTIAQRPATSSRSRPT
jgi:P4 family phage/plasmid primase-like protien